MYIVMLSAECAPVAKAGGLGDFVHGLARALLARGHQVEVVLPRYDCLVTESLLESGPGLADLWVPFYQQWIHCEVTRALVEDIPCWLIAPHSPQQWFERGRIYGEPDDPERFAFFCRAALEFLQQTQRQPDILQCNDWQTGLIPVLLFEIYQGLGLTRPRVCYTLHNLGYQGITDESVLRQVGLDPQRLMTPDRLADPKHPQAVNLMKGGLVFANQITTVSPRYAWEVQHTEQGLGLQETLRRQPTKFRGVLNGIDFAAWNPATDPWIPSRYEAATLPAKAANKSALRARLGLAEGNKPLLCLISRLDQQKGVALIEHALRFGLAGGSQVVLLGSAQDPQLEAHFQRLRRELGAHPDGHLELRYDERLAHGLYAAADLIVVPSVYEPCGLTQMIAMRYGAVPVVRRVGGLADTVFDANYSDQPFEERNGYVFDDLTGEALESALGRALGLWFEYPEYFRQLRLNGMRQDHSWNRPAEQYLALFEAMRADPGVGEGSPGDGTRGRIPDGAAPP